MRYPVWRIDALWDAGANGSGLASAKRLGLRRPSAALAERPFATHRFHICLSPPTAGRFIFILRNFSSA
jgi:hypothetical protein